MAKVKFIRIGKATIACEVDTVKRPLPGMAPGDTIVLSRHEIEMPELTIPIVDYVGEESALEMQMLALRLEKSR